MQEIVTISGMTRLFVALAVLSPLIGIAWAAVALSRRRDRRSVRQTALLWILSGPANLCLWRLYNLLTEHNGLDTVRNLVVNVSVFLVIGLIIGFVVGRLGPEKDAEAPAPASSDEAEHDCAAKADPVAGSG